MGLNPIRFSVRRGRDPDRARDNGVVERARVTLRYGWKPVVDTPRASARPGRARAGQPSMTTSSKIGLSLPTGQLCVTAAGSQ